MSRSEAEGTTIRSSRLCDEATVRVCDPKSKVTGTNWFAEPVNVTVAVANVLHNPRTSAQSRSVACTCTLSVWKSLAAANRTRLVGPVQPNRACRVEAEALDLVGTAKRQVRAPLQDAAGLVVAVGIQVRKNGVERGSSHER